MKKYTLICSFIVTFSVFSCKEVYEPEISDMPKILVVDGLITNEVKSHTIRLSSAIQFDTTGFLPETGATVYVTDNYGVRCNFNEKGDGNYASDPTNFKPQIGSTYTLSVETKNKKVYKSAEQELLAKGTQYEFTNVPKSIRYYYTLGDLQYLNVKGSEFYTLFDLSNEQNPYFRFSSSVLVEYTSKFSFNLKLIYYSWKKYNLNEYFNINTRQYNYSGQFQHDLGFCPLDSLFYSVRLLTIPIKATTKVIYEYQDVYKYLISFKQYHLNEDVYKYYELLNKQLEANQRIFDPISFQIEGNLKCVSDPNEKVFGLFEASSVNILTYVIDYNLTSSSYRLQKINPMDQDSISISNSGKDTIPPQFWIN